MAAYRLYCLNREGSISTADWIEADDDQEAIAKAPELKRHGLKCEVWQEKRLVAKLDVHDLADEESV